LFLEKIKPSNKLVIASHNQGKVNEIRDLLGPLGLELISAAKLGLPEPEETANTFSGNARLKAEAATFATGFPAFADDSGLVVDALDGKPGIFSARWAGDDKNFARAMAKVNFALCEIDVKHKVQASRSASFFCALALAWPDNTTEIFEGWVDGTLCWPPRGGNGFGYDPIFIPAGYDETFGEFDQKVKHSISHRAKAFAKFLSYVQNDYHEQ
jgi:XTP/dITP diphosphohydrolase